MGRLQRPGNGGGKGINLGGFGLGLLPEDLADHHEMRLAVEPKDNPVSASTVLNSGHWTTPMPPRRCCQVPQNPKSKGLRRPMQPLMPLT
jgi:hypothetical protein